MYFFITKKYTYLYLEQSAQNKKDEFKSFKKDNKRSYRN
jgi:hypothetical protein